MPQNPPLQDPTIPPPPAVAPTLSSQPTLSPQFCFNTTALRDFLRLSRSTVDDSISAHLNALLQPSRPPINTGSTSTPPSTLRGSRQNIPGSACRDFKRGILFPSWKVREDVLTYCSVVAELPDPDTSSLSSTSSASAVHEQRASVDPASPISPINALADGKVVSRNYWGKPQVVDERLDPYSARDYSYTREPRQEVLRDVLQLEAGVERIVRARTWGVLGDRCVDPGWLGAVAGGGSGWEGEWQEWRRETGEGKIDR